MKLVEINPLILAYLGDAIYEVYIRKYLIAKGIKHVKELQESSIAYVSAKSQASILRALQNQNIFTVEEQEILRRARNTKVNSHPKNCSVITYHEATAFEALLGYLYLKNDTERLDLIIKKILEEE